MPDNVALWKEKSPALLRHPPDATITDPIATDFAVREITSVSSR